MERMKPSTAAWIGLGVGVAAYEAFCPQGETLSEGVDRALETKVGKYIVLGSIALTACHLANITPQKYDPFHYALMWKKVKEAS